MKTWKHSLNRAGLVLAVMTGLSTTAAGGSAPAERATPVSLDQIGALAGAQDQGSALCVTATPDGARLCCGFQELAGRVGADGLWLESTEPGARGKLRLVGTALGRDGALTPQRQIAHALAATGLVRVSEGIVRLTRAGLTEEYSVSADGVQQDFVIASPPGGRQLSTSDSSVGELRLMLALTGARAEPAPCGAKIRFESSGRELAYRRLRATDATGKELKARLEVVSSDRLMVLVADGNATYPVRIDPTFSDADWIKLNTLPGTDGSVSAIAVDGSNIYVGGSFWLAGSVEANGIARWDGSTWSALGSGMAGGADGYTWINALAVCGTNLYVGGRFGTAGGVAADGIAKWDGNTWSALGSGLISPYPSGPLVQALAVSGTDLYVAGRFTTAGGLTVSNVAKWDGSSWSALGSGIARSSFAEVDALAVAGPNLYVSGYFTSAGGVAATNIAQWNGSSWSALGEGLPMFLVGPLAAHGTDLYVGAHSAMPGLDYIEKWDGATWSDFAVMDDFVSTLAFIGDDLYAGGSFEAVSWGAGSNTDAFCIAKWDGNTWSAVGSGFGFVGSGVNVLAADGTNLYAGGWFNTDDNIAKWDGGTWSALGQGIISFPHALAVGGSALYAGGEFTSVCGVRSNCIARWDGSAWSCCTSGFRLGAMIEALAVDGTNLYVGGSFTAAGEVAATNVARWDGSSWTSLGPGLDNSVSALAVSGTNLYAGGWFTMAGDLQVNCVAKWDGNNWSALAPGFMVSPGSSSVNALAVSGDQLYAGGGGFFVPYSDHEVWDIAVWDGNSWSGLGSGINGSVNALAVSGTNLYVGGSFTTAGDAGATNIAKWDGNAWSALGAGLDDQVTALALVGTNLYAAGSFTNAGGLPANGIAKWDGASWSGLGAGLTEFPLPWVQATALAADGRGHLFVAGGFRMAGTNLSPYLAQANVGLGVAGGRFDTPAGSPSAPFRCVFCDGTVGQSYRIQSSLSPGAGSWSDLTNLTYRGPVVISDPSSVARPKRYYRAVSP